MLFWGVLCGVFAAFFQDAGYICSRAYVKKTGDPAGLLVRSQVILGVFSLLILPFLFLFGVPSSYGFIVPLMCVAVGSGGGQFFFFRAEKVVSPARVSSLMGLRIVLLAVVTSVLWHEEYHVLQWCGVGLAAFSAFLLNWDGGRLRMCGMGDFSLSLAFYCLSDLNVALMVRGFGFSSFVIGSLFSMCAVNILTGIVLLPFLRKSSGRLGLSKALPFACLWGSKQFFLYLCYAFVGPVTGNVILAVRGPLAVPLAYAARKSGLEKGEDVERSGSSIRRWSAILLMMAAIIMYTLHA